MTPETRWALTFLIRNTAITVAALIVAGLAWFKFHAGAPVTIVLLALFWLAAMASSIWTLKHRPPRTTI